MLRTLLLHQYFAQYMCSAHYGCFLCFLNFVLSRHVAQVFYKIFLAGTSSPIIIIEFFTSQFWLGNIHLSWDVVINRIRLRGLTCSLKSFLQLNMCQELQIFAVVYMYSGAS